MDCAWGPKRSRWSTTPSITPSRPMRWSPASEPGQSISTTNLPSRSASTTVRMRPTHRLSHPVMSLPPHLDLGVDHEQWPDTQQRVRGSKPVTPFLLIQRASERHAVRDHMIDPLLADLPAGALDLASPGDTLDLVEPRIGRDLVNLATIDRAAGHGPAALAI